MTQKKRNNLKIDISRFLAGDKIQGCEEGLWTYYEPAQGAYYRLVHNPVSKGDQVPKSLLTYENLAEDEIDLEQELLAPSLTLKEQRTLLNDYGLSGNVSFDKLKAIMLKYANKRNGQDLEIWLANMGDCIAKYNLLPEVGYIEKIAKSDGHKNLHLFKDVNLEDYRDIDFGLIPLMKNDE